MTDHDIISSWCNSCSRDTEHDLVHQELMSSMECPDAAYEKRQFLARCRGCKELTIRIEGRYFHYIPDETADGSYLTELEYHPPRLWRRRPDWLAQLEPLDPDLTDILKEVYSATNDNQFRLLAMGVRTALDHVMTKMIGDIGGFDKKLEEMVKQGHLTMKQKENLETVIDAGSATAHRGYKPSQTLLLEMVITMEMIIRDHYITGPMLQTLKTHIPPRPPRATISKTQKT